MHAHFVAFAEHELHADADAQEGDAALDGLVDGGRQVALVQASHSRAKRADAGQNQLLGPPHHFRVFGQDDGSPDLFKRFLRRANVAGAVVDHGYCLCHTISIW